MTRCRSARKLAMAATVILAAGACQDNQPAGAPAANPADHSSTPPSGSSPSSAASPSTTLPSPTDPPRRPAGLSAGRSDPVADPLYRRFGNPAVDVLHYGLRLRWQPARRVLTGTATIDLRMAEAADEVRLDFGDPLRVDKVSVDGRSAQASHPGHDLVVRTGRLQRGDRLRLVVTYHGRPEPIRAPTTRPDLVTVGFTVERDGSAWTLQEPYGALTWYPVNDHPSDKALYDITVTVPNGWAGIANGLLVSRSQRAGTTTYRWRARDPIASYLTTIGIGRYRYESDTGPHGLPVNYWVLPGDEYFLTAARQTPELISWLEERLGPYPFETVGVMGVDSRSGMETQTLVTISPRVPAAVLLHEYAHQWYGDSVTPRTWDDLWLNEGFAFYLDWVYADDQGGISLRASAREARHQDQRLRNMYGPPGDYDPRQFASYNVYSSGALMLYELRQRLGADVFDRLLRQWPQEHRYENVDRETYVAWVEQKTGEDVSAFVDRWLTSPTTPK